MIAALLDESGIVVDAFVVSSIPDGLVACPDHVGIGMHIDAPIPVPEPDPDTLPVTEV